MPKFLAGCHYNEEEISRHLKKNIGYWPVQINGNKFATGQILRKPVEVVKGRILAGWAQKSPEPWMIKWLYRLGLYGATTCNKRVGGKPLSNLGVGNSLIAPCLLLWKSFPTCAYSVDTGLGKLDPCKSWQRLELGPCPFQSTYMTVSFQRKMLWLNNADDLQILVEKCTVQSLLCLCLLYYVYGIPHKQGIP